MTADDDFSPSPAPSSDPRNDIGDQGRYQTKADGSMRDRLLDRPIAIRSTASAEADELQAEARFLGRLDHAGLPCVHDFVRGDDGALLVTRPIKGRSLTTAVVARANGEHLPALADPAACTLSFMAVCDAITAAHLQGVVHGALRSDVIMITDDGQVVIDGWDSAVKAKQRPLTMRINAQASVPAALSLDGLHEDIRGLGVCLYLALVGETPPRDPSGQLADMSFTAKSRIPLLLEPIIRKAMASTAADGYQTVADVRGDLARFLTGQAPHAVGPSQLTVIAHWFANHRRALLATSLTIIIVIGSLLAYNWRAVQTYASWGTPIVEEHFANDAWKSQWATRGSWVVKDEKLVSQAEYDSALIFKKRLNPPVAIEYTGRFSASVRAGDLSVWWCEGDAFGTGYDKTPTRQPGWFIQAGAYSNSWCTIYRVPGRVRAEVTNLVLKPDRDYHFRVEITEDRMRMWIDGEPVLDHTEMFPIGSGTIALYSWDPGKSFDDVRIWQRQVPDMISPLALGDDAYRAGRFADADAAYGRVAESHEGQPLGIQALYFQGLAQRKLGNRAKAWKTWQTMPDGILRYRAESLTIDDRVEANEVKSAADRFAAMWQERPEIHSDLRQRWQNAGQILNLKRPLPKQDIETWLKVRDDCFGDDKPSCWLVADLLNKLSRWDIVAQKFPDERRAVGPALLALGRNSEVATGDWTTSYERILALVGMGDLEGALKSPDIHRKVRGDLLCKVGRAEEAAQISAYPAMIYLGQIDEQLKINGFGEDANDALIVAGRLEEAAGAGAPGSPDSGHDSRALLLLGRFDEVDKGGSGSNLFRMLALLASSHLDEARALRPSVTGNVDATYNGLWFAHGVGLAMVDEALGENSALKKAVEKCCLVTGAWGGRMAAVCKAALDPTQEAALLAMPWKTETAAWLLIAQALRAELAQDHSQALAAWKSFAALPAVQRILDDNCLNLEVEAFAAWRIATLTR